MTRYIVNIEDEKDLPVLIHFLRENGIKYELNADDEEVESILKEDTVAYQKTDSVEDYEDFIYTDELKRQLDEDEEVYQRGELKLITPEESRAEIDKILAGLK